jgi:Putative beta-barrel porin-2, OmpL-like. bbp2/Carboxypeptidase regulatory-like domain
MHDFMVTHLRHFLGFLSAFAVLASFTTTAFAENGSGTSDLSNTNSGSIHGTVVREDGGSRQGAQVVIRSDKGDFRVVVASDAAGEFSVASLSAGRYEVVPAALEGGANTAVKVEVVAGGDAEATVDLQTPAPAAPVQAPAAVPVTPIDNGFFHRLGRAYVADWGGNGPGTAVPQATRRGTPAPIFSPPYPAADWPIGGTPTIGVPDGQTYPLMQAINQNKGEFKIYGWIEVGANGSTNNQSNASKGIPANFPSAYDEFSNQIQMDQLALYLEKYPNTAQKDHFDWGYRVAGLYGVDYRFTTAKGMLSQQLLVKNAEYGFDPVMVYLDFYFPRVGKGMDVRVGRYISLPDIEAQLAPNNYTYSHSILYTFDCYTQTGINATIKVNDHLTVQAGLSPGCDVMPWTTDARVTGNFCATYTWSNGGDALNTCANSVNNGKYAYNNLAAYYETWYHRINATWHTDTEFWYQYMKDTPNEYWYNSGIGPTSATPWPEHTAANVTLNFGAVCKDPRLSSSNQPAECFAQEWAVTNYVEHNFWHNEASLNIRNEVVNDIKGQRTGTPGYYEEHMVGFDFWAGSTVTFRPEVSYTHTFSPYGLRALDINPGSSVAAVTNLSQGETSYQAMQILRAKTQAITLAADIIWHF